ncbi:MAG: aromatic amino acid transport family protein [Patescibacteria group bacterium]
MNKSAVLSVGLLAGTIIGAGIFSLPYLFYRVGIIPGILYLILFSVVYIAFYFMYSELLLKENEPHDFFALARKHLSKKTSHLASFFVIGELLFALVVYLILAETFLDFGFGIKGTIPVLLFWACSSIFMFIRLNWLGVIEVLSTLSIIVVVIFIFFIGGLTTNNSNFSLFPSNVDWKLLLLPFGPLLFSFSGRPAVSKVVEEYRKSKEEGNPFSIKKSLVWGTIVPAVIYLFFVLSVFRLGGAISPDTFSGLTFLSPLISALLGILGLIALWDSYFVIGINIKDILTLDARWPKWIGAGTSLFLPLVLYAFGFKDFLLVLGLVGGIFIAFEGIFVTRMWQRAFPLHKFRKIAGTLYIVFFIAIIYEVLNIVFGL